MKARYTLTTESLDEMESNNYFGGYPECERMREIWVENFEAMYGPIPYEFDDEDAMGWACEAVLDATMACGQLYD